MATKFIMVLSEQGYMTRRRSSPIHIVMYPWRVVSLSVAGFSLICCIGTRNRKALLPDPKGVISVPATILRVTDC
jgi:hypothetical protein